MHGDKFCEKVVEYVLKCSLEQLKDLTIEDVAAHFGTTKMTLTTKFKTQKKMTPGKFITREKMYRALIIMVKNPSFTIDALTEKVGFSTSDYFIRVFKEYFGTSPGRYRDGIKKMSGRQKDISKAKGKNKSLKK